MRRKMVLLVAVVLGLAVLVAAAADGRNRPRCYGAASRDPEQRCDNPELRTAVIPTPKTARGVTNAACTIIARKGSVSVCVFGVPAAHATGTIALLGDSHAMHWRGALDVVTHARRWRGLSVARGGCPFSLAVKLIAEPSRSVCMGWKRDVLRWFRSRPDVRTVFVSEYNSPTPVAAYKGRTGFEANVSGYVDAWNALPPSVRRIVVIRDTPRALDGTAGCVEGAMVAHRDAGAACAMARGAVLPPDPAEVAARRTRDRRVELVDLTPFLCDPGRCYPVVGGALVFKDTTHLTKAFSASLGPYLLRAIAGVR